MKIKKPRKIFISICVATVIFTLAFLTLDLIYNSYSISTQKQYPVTSLNEIIPGQTNLQDALSILGTPDSVEDSSYHPTRLFDDVFEHLPNMKVYIFASRQGWDYTELWVQKRGSNQLVVAVLRYLPANLQATDNPSLEDFVAVYGHPDEVLWSSLCYFRYLIWPKEGVAIHAGGHTYINENGTIRQLSWKELPIAEVFLFEPMNTKDIVDVTKWPWPNKGPGWNAVNTCKEDHDPQDPYDWKHLPTPRP